MIFRVACVLPTATGVTTPPPGRVNVAPARLKPCTTTPVSVCPMTPYKTEMEVIAGGGVNASVPEFAVTPFTVTLTCPLGKAGGICTTRAVEEAEITVAATPPNCTMSLEAVELKFWP